MAHYHGTNYWFRWLNPDDTLRAGSEDDYMWGYHGDDELYGRGGDDRIWGGSDDDLLDGSRGRDSLYGESGDDTLIGSEDGDFLDGGTGDDVASYEYSWSGVRVRLADHLDSRSRTEVSGDHADDDQLVNIEGVIGTRYDDTLIGNQDWNYLSGGDGNDHIIGGGAIDRYEPFEYRFVEGGDTLKGGAGNDTLETGNGDADLVDGGPGIDTIQLIDDGVVALWRESVVNVENVVGSDGHDSFDGDHLNNRLEGRAGDDRIEGFEDNDTLIGGDGDDTLMGGDGADRFEFEGDNGYWWLATDAETDYIRDFEPGTDKIVFEFGSGWRLSWAVDSFDEVMDNAQWVDDTGYSWFEDSGTEIALNGDTLYLLDVRPEELSASDFVFL